MRKLLVAYLLVAGALPAAESAVDRATVVVVAGAPGDSEFTTVFDQEVKTWTGVCARAEAKSILVGTGPGDAISDHEHLKQVLADESKDALGELWVILVGHGTFDGKEAKFNLRGPDVSATELAEWLKPFRRPLAIIDTSSASAPFLAKLSAANRVIVTSTRSGFEQNYARFGKFFAEAIADPASDLDKDGQVSLLEAYLAAARRTAEFYQTEGRLATEHALLDDNGDGLGTPADWFKGMRATKQAREGASLDGARAQQFVLVRSAAERELTPALRAQRDELELAAAKLRERKAKLPEDVYFRELEKLLLQLAALYDGA